MLTTARQLYLAKTHDRAGLQKLLSVSERSLREWLGDIDKAEKEERNRKITDLNLACFTQDEIAERLNVPRTTVEEALTKTASLPFSSKVTFSEEGFTPPLYNVWTFSKKTNEVAHFGNSEQQVDNYRIEFISLRIAALHRKAQSPVFAASDVSQRPAHNQRITA